MWTVRISDAAAQEDTRKGRPYGCGGLTYHPVGADSIRPHLRSCFLNRKNDTVNQ